MIGQGKQVKFHEKVIVFGYQNMKLKCRSQGRENMSMVFFCQRLSSWYILPVMRARVYMPWNGVLRSVGFYQGGNCSIV